MHAQPRASPSPGYCTENAPALDPDCTGVSVNTAVPYLLAKPPQAVNGEALFSWAWYTA